MPSKSKNKMKNTNIQVSKTVSSQPKSSVFDYLRFGESYTSLILGIVVVIISTILLLSFVHTKNANRNASHSQIALQQNNSQSKEITLVSPTISVTPTTAVTIVPSPTIIKQPTPTVVKKVTPTSVKPKPSAEPKKIAIARVTVTPKPAMKQNVKATPSPKILADNTVKTVVPNGTYVVAPGDSLWTIAEKTYKSGYNWVDIARANNLSNPGDIHKGDKLALPKVAPKLATVVMPTVTVSPMINKTIQNPSTVTSPNKIVGTSYKIVKGDSLWTIAVRAYGDGYKWVDIARVNNLSNPGLIHVDNTLRIPRG
jgi:putative chitinase